MGRKPQVSREQVLQAARDLFCARGYHEVSLADIGAALGISAAAVLRHAPTKEALFEQALVPRESDLHLPADMLRNVDPKQDPRAVLRDLARKFVPFIEARLSEQVTVWMHARTAADAKRIAGFLQHPFGKIEGPTPPQRVLALLENYFRRAAREGRLQVKDPKAAALVFLGSLHSYVTLHRLLRVLDPPMPLEQYIDTVIEIWTKGAIRPPGRK